MRYICLALIALGALCFPFAAKRALIGLSANEGHDLRTALILFLVGAVLVGTGVFLAKRDEITTQWRNRNRSRRIRLRG